jgi:hypothetical protein
MKGKKGNNSIHKGGSERNYFQHEQRSERSVQIRRKLTRLDLDAASTGTVLGYFFSSVGVTSCSEWAGLSVLYEEYRVRAIRVKLCPVLLTTVVSPPTAAAYTAAYPGPIASANYGNGTGAAGINAVLASDGSRVHAANASVMEQLVTWDLNPQAKMWTSTGIAIPVLSQIGVEFIGTVVALLAINTATTHFVFVECDVEFRGRQ